MRNKIIFLLFFLNFSCSPSYDVEKWAKNEKSSILNKKNKIKDNKDNKDKFKLMGFNYDSPNNEKSPFDSSRLTLEVESGRKKEVLEDFNLSDLKYLGYFNKNGISTAYIMANNIVYNVHIGNYIGKNNGKIVDIRPDKIIIDEFIVNNDGQSSLNENEILIMDN